MRSANMAWLFETSEYKCITLKEGYKAYRNKVLEGFNEKKNFVVIGGKTGSGKTIILNELKKPGLDPRSEAQAFEFANIYSIDDVKIGMEVPGVVTNITRFGAFIDIGVKQDGLVHISELADRYVKDPLTVVAVGQVVQVRVLKVDKQRGRVQLSMRGIPK